MHHIFFCQGPQLHLLLAAQLASRPRTRLLVEGGIEADLHKAFLGTIDGRAAGLHRCLVADAGTWASINPSQSLRRDTGRGRQFAGSYLGLRQE